MHGLGWLVVWLVGRLVGRLVGLLVGRLVGRSVGRSQQSQLVVPQVLPVGYQHTTDCCLTYNVTV